MTTGWVCPLCGSSNAPQLLQCPCRNPEAASSSNLDAGAATSSGNAVAGSGSSKATARQRTKVNYNDPLFLVFWENYPLHKGKADAFKRWQQVVAAGADPQQLIAAAAAYARDPSRNPLKTKHAEGWLTSRRWEDEPVQMRHPLAAVEDTDPAQVVGTPEYDARVHAEEEAAIAAALEAEA